MNKTLTPSVASHYIGNEDGTVLFYWGGSFVLGPSYAMTWAAPHQAAPAMYAPLLLVSFLLVLVGYLRTA